MVIKRLMNKKLKNVVFSIITCSVLIVIINYKLRRYQRNQDNPNSSFTDPNYNIHIFYNGGYRNPKIDGAYQQWNYDYFNRAYLINDTYYPVEGLYSSRNTCVINWHMRQIRDANIGVIIIEWWPHDYENAPELSTLFDCAMRYNIKVTIQIQNYANRNVTNLHKNIYNFFSKYRLHPSLYWHTYKSKRLPLLYIHESHLIPMSHWNQLLGYLSQNFGKNTSLNAFYIGHIKEDVQKYIILNSDFDGFYTYNPDLNDGIKWTRWPYLQDFAKEHNLIFIPTVSPGVKLLSVDNYDKRSSGRYYMTSWMRAIVSRASVVSINSFNGWIDGTQIEPAKPHKIYKQNRTLAFASYLPNSPDYYMSLTQTWIYKFSNASALRYTN